MIPRLRCASLLTEGHLPWTELPFEALTVCGVSPAPSCSCRVASIRRRRDIDAVTSAYLPMAFSSRFVRNPPAFTPFSTKKARSSSDKISSSAPIPVPVGIGMYGLSAALSLPFPFDCELVDLPAEAFSFLLLF